jgi:hypothetical protein
LNALRHFGFGKRSIESKIVEEAGFFVEVLEKNKGLPVCNEDPIRKAINPIENVKKLKRRNFHSNRSYRYVLLQRKIVA